MFLKTNRKHSKIDALTENLKNTVDQMLLSGATYSEIVEFLSDNGVGLSCASVCRYARGFNANLETLQIAHENFNRLMNEMERFPDLDTTEAIIRLASQNLLNALVNKTEADWADISVDKMITQVNGLIRAAAYKKRVEIQNKDEVEGGLDEIKAMTFKAMASENPTLYRQFTEYLENKKENGF